MSDTDRPQITLITPPAFEIEVFAPRLAALLDAHQIACLRLSMASREEEVIARAADALREIAHTRDVAIVVDDHVLLAQRHGLDGVHLTNTRKNIRKLRDDMGPDAIIGAWCGQTRHDGINAAEAGADYVAFGPIGATPLGDGSTADFDLFEWWSAMIEVPVIAEGALTVDLVAKFGPVTDFFGIGPELWGADDASAALKALMAPLG